MEAPPGSAAVLGMPAEAGQHRRRRSGVGHPSPRTGPELRSGSVMARETPLPVQHSTHHSCHLPEREQGGQGPTQEETLHPAVPDKLGGRGERKCLLSQAPQRGTDGGL